MLAGFLYAAHSSCGCSALPRLAAPLQAPMVAIDAVPQRRWRLHAVPTDLQHIT